MSSNFVDYLAEENIKYSPAMNENLGALALSAKAVREAAICLILNPNAFWARLVLVQYAFPEEYSNRRLHNGANNELTNTEFSDGFSIDANTENDITVKLSQAATKIARGIRKFKRFKTETELQDLKKSQEEKLKELAGTVYSERIYDYRFSLLAFLRVICNYVNSNKPVKNGNVNPAGKPVTKPFHEKTPQGRQVLNHYQIPLSPQEIKEAIRLNNEKCGNFNVTISPGQPTANVQNPNFIAPKHINPVPVTPYESPEFKKITGLFEEFYVSGKNTMIHCDDEETRNRDIFVFKRFIFDEDNGIQTNPESLADLYIAEYGANVTEGQMRATRYTRLPKLIAMFEPYLINAMEAEINVEELIRNQ
ncbi:MAG: hypothetical protein LBS21_00260 [Clostridiales bacterium]|jgi:hypothetical protein|nr:hypothetical protein [Clostridiales bacterium]